MSPRVGDTCTCPACWHGDTMRARLAGEGHVDRDHVSRMHWNKPYGGPRGQMITPWDGGYWECEHCQIRLHTDAAFALLDAVLRDSDPGCDSIRNGVHLDAWQARDPKLARKLESTPKPAGDGTGGAR